MKAAYTSAFALVAVLAAGPAAAEHVSFTSVDHMVKAEPGVAAKTRAQVMAELADAQKSMDARPSDQFGRTVSEAYPGGKPAVAVAEGKTRDQVRAELADASRTLDFRPSDQFGRTVSEAYPGYVVPTSTASANGAKAG